MTTNTDLLQKSESIEYKIDRVFNEVCDGHVPEALEDLAIEIGNALEDLRAALQPPADTRELVDRLKSYIPNGDGYNSQFAHDLAAAITALEQQAQGGGWMPIETAPEDAELLLGWWEDWPELKWREEVAVYHYTRAGTWHGYATHFQPLPPAPDRSEER